MMHVHNNVVSPRSANATHARQIDATTILFIHNKKKISQNSKNYDNNKTSIYSTSILLQTNARNVLCFVRICVNIEPKDALEDQHQHPASTS